MILKLENVSKAFLRQGKRIEALRDISLELGRGDFVGIFGPGGSGKTTLLKVAAGQEAPDRGSVSYQGQLLSEMSKAELRRYRRREVGLIRGTRYLNPGLSVLENVALPMLLDGSGRHGAERGAREQLLAVGADHLADARPNELSDAERQRVSIAQALITKPRLLLADEPASNLDFFERDSILTLFGSLAQDARMAVLVVDTDASALMHAKPILYLRGGELLTTRPHKRMGELVELAERLKAGERSGG